MNTSALVRLLLGLTLITCLNGCRASQPPSPVTAWSYTDLRFIDATTALEPSHDILAAYLRRTPDRFQIRLDMLELAPLPDFDLWVLLDTQPGGGGPLPVNAAAALDWDLLLSLPASGKLEVSTPGGQLVSNSQLRLSRDLRRDSLEISLSRALLPSPSRPVGVRIFIASPTSPDQFSQVSQGIGPIREDDPPPPPANVLFAFWNTFPAYTPAMVLRRWDGAHTGPLGGRHGLYNLLRTARGAQAPLFLLDLASPLALSALEYAGGLPLVQQQLEAGQIILPAPLPAGQQTGWGSLPPGLQAALAQHQRQTARAYGISSRGFAFAPDFDALAYTEAIWPGASSPTVIFTWLPDSQNTFSAAPAFARLYRRSQHTLVALPAPAAILQPDETGLPLDLRRQLTQAALASTHAQPPLLVLGGSLPNSTWGNPQAARASFDWLQAHPWIRFVTPYTLLSASPPALDSSFPTLASNPALQAAWSAVQPLPGFLPDNPARQAALLALESLLAPLPSLPPQELSRLRQHYLSQIYTLLAAASWAESPAASAGCDVDLNQDGRSECILASDTFYAVFEPETGALTLAYARLDGQLYGLVAPSSQFITGLSDPLEWDLSRGLSADPAVIPGAFSGPGRGGYNASFETLPGGETRLVFTASGGSHRKSYRLLEPAGLHFEYASLGGSTPANFALPLALQPEQRFTPGWVEQYAASPPPADCPGQCTWQLPGSGPAALHLTWSADPGAKLSFTSFTQALSLQGKVEDPNREPPAGYHLPLPLTLLQLEGVENLSFSMQLDHPGP